MGGREVRGEPVGEAPQAGRVVPVPEPFGLAVAEGDVAYGFSVRHGLPASP
ncbi:hypothetical protein Sros01_65530 [Streptomyces roseochromogenus]|nr:hypothetical protein Sros01_65530 [Streptomyces roseochromogenus]